MAKEIAVVHHRDRHPDVVMPYAPGIVVRCGHLVFLSGVTAAPVYRSHPQRDEEFDLPATMREQARLATHACCKLEISAIAVTEGG
jgi:enamine deaminase RidA (YjgF/YER057c/UK114 family)